MKDFLFFMINFYIMNKKVFQTCYNCEHKSSCAVSKSRLEGVDINSPVIKDVGCFDFEIYRKQKEDRQLKLEI